ncbi:MAG TPA: TadE/TadG family type IV pilus assembly protein [Rhizomicrobium sp.]|nr:TadE/TadG family type IV pilus assembly protein [Rhizomicrobium sp.]
MRAKSRLVIASVSGSAAIEFGLIFPLLLVLLAGVVEVGFAMREAMQVQDAAEVGAGYAIKNGWNSAAISAAVVNATGATGVTAAPAPTQYCGCPGAAGVTAVLCTATCAAGVAPGVYVRVNASRPHVTILNNLGLPIPATITAHAIVRLQ